MTSSHYKTRSSFPLTPLRSNSRVRYHILLLLTLVVVPAGLRTTGAAAGSRVVLVGVVRRGGLGARGEPGVVATLRLELVSSRIQW